ncbi:MAG: GrpB family protein [Saprospiraceae bacterium]
MSKIADPIIVVPYDPHWKEEFQLIARQIRVALGSLALRIDHVGSTSVEGLAAKPVIDIQISVADLKSLEPIQSALESIGLKYRAENPDQTKHYFREGAGMRRTHLHVREAGSYSEQLALLFRDYLRAHPAACAEYAALKYDLMQRFGDDRDGIWRKKRLLSGKPCNRLIFGRRQPVGNQGNRIVDFLNVFFIAIVTTFYLRTCLFSCLSTIKCAAKSCKKSQSSAPAAPESQHWRGTWGIY